MTKIATITSKRQLTIPIKLYKKLNLKKGEKVIISLEDGIIKVEPAISLVDRFYGSVSVARKYQNTPVDEAIRLGKINHFSRKIQ